MKKLTLTLVVILLLLAAIPVAATGPAEDDFGGEGEAWKDDGGGHYTNNFNGDVRFDWENHRMAVPGDVPEDIPENAAVIYRSNNEPLVDPHDTLSD